MNKRMRKKKRVGEFKELGFELDINFVKELSVEEIDQWHDDFLNFIDSINVFCGGGGSNEALSFYIYKNSYSIKNEDRETIIEWLKNQKQIQSFLVGEIVDMNDM